MLPNGVVNKPNDGVAFDFAEYVSTKKVYPKMNHQRMSRQIRLSHGI